MKSIIVPCLAFLCLALPAHALYPPWVVIAQKLTASIGADPCVKVGQPTSPPRISITIRACNGQVAQALATVLQSAPEEIALNVVDQTGRPVRPVGILNLAAAVKIVSVAFRGNPYFAKAYPFGILGPAKTVMIEFKPQVIRVGVDNIGNPYGTNAYVAADLFGEFLARSLGQFPTGTVTGPGH